MFEAPFPHQSPYNWIWVVAIPEGECLFCLGDFLIRERTGIVGFLSES